MKDGRTIFAGLSPDTMNPMYAMPIDVALTYTFNEVQRCAEARTSRRFAGTMTGAFRPRMN